MTDYDTIVREVDGRVGIITLNRPKALNALNATLMHEVVSVARGFDENPAIGCIIITGSERAFAAGADISEMATLSFDAAYSTNLFAEWDALPALRTPTIAAVAGYALGGGCELAMMCDLIIAADTARFGQPEITLGVIPGMGGSQRLTRAIGKAKAMDLILTGRMMHAAEAELCGLVSRVVPAELLQATARDVAATIAGMSLHAAMAAKEAVNRAFESSLADGILFERRTFQAQFGLDHQKEGMAAFLAKRAPDFSQP